VSEFSIAALSLLGLSSVVILCLAIFSIRRDHPHHIHTLWYIFSLTLCAVSVLFLYIYANKNVQGTLLDGATGQIAVIFMNASMDVREEIYILIVILALFVLPQILSYGISGTFGCGSPPIFVSTISRIVTWSLIKFFAVLSGILAAQSILALYGRPYLYPRDCPTKLVESAVMISISFLTMAMYYKIGEIYNHISRHLRLRAFEAFHRFMTRYRES